MLACIFSWSGRSPLSLTVDAALEAITDAGLSTADIDGISTWPGAFAASPGFSGVGCWEMKDALGLNLNWFSGGMESHGQLGAVINDGNTAATTAAADKYYDQAQQIIQDEAAGVGLYDQTNSIAVEDNLHGVWLEKSQGEPVFSDAYFTQ